MTSDADRPLLAPGSRAELRAWLAANHADSAPVRLAVGKKGGHVTSLTYDEAVEEALCFGWIDSTARKLDADRYTVLLARRRRGSTWAATNKGRVERLTAAGLMQPAGLAIVEAAKADGTWDLLTDVEALVMPADLAAALAAEPGAAASFEALPLSERKLALWRVVSAKRPETRARRITDAVTAALGTRPPDA